VTHRTSVRRTGPRGGGRGALTQDRAGLPPGGGAVETRWAAGPSSVGQQTVFVWSDPLEDGCTQTALTLFLSNLSKAEGRREILRVAESLASPP